MAQCNTHSVLTGSLQPIAPADVADVLAEIAVGERSASRHVAGPEVRKTWWTWPGVPTPPPGEGARIAPTTFDEWLVQQR